MRILITRQFLLSNFSTLGQVEKPEEEDSERQKYVQDCINAAYVIIDTGTSYAKIFQFSLTLFSGRFRGCWPSVSSSATQNMQSLTPDPPNCSIKGFWFTQYIALCAISTLYIYIIHYRLDPNSLMSPDGKSYFAAAGKCRDYIGSLAPEGSHSRRYNTLLTRLSRRAMKSMGDATVGFKGDRMGYNATEAGGLLAQNHVPEPVYNDSFYGEGGNGEHGVGMQTGFATGDQEVGMQMLEYTDPGSGSGIDIDAFQLSWGYLDQLGKSHGNCIVEDLLTVSRSA